MKIKKIILDTNFLMAPFQFKIDIFAELKRLMYEPFKVYILKETIEELGYIIEKQRAKNKEFAKLAKQYVKIMNIEIIDITKQKDLYITNISKSNRVDDILVGMAEAGYIIATADAELKKRLKEKGNKSIILRSKSHLEID
jgi:hypothetical protein